MNKNRIYDLCCLNQRKIVLATTSGKLTKRSGFYIPCLWHKVYWGLDGLLPSYIYAVCGFWGCKDREERQEAHLLTVSAPKWHMCLLAVVHWPEVVLWPWPNYKADWEIYRHMGLFDDRCVCYIYSKNKHTTFLRAGPGFFPWILMLQQTVLIELFFSCVHHSYHSHTKIFLAEL